MNKKRPQSTIPKLLQNLMLATVFVVALSGCYRMPNDDDYSLVPTTNNPEITRECGNQLVPGGDF